MDGRRWRINLRDIQVAARRFEEERGWDRFPASLVFVHLTEELGEIGAYILSEEGYKARGLGHEAELGDIGREFAQAFSLILQLANHFKVDLEGEFLKELEVMEARFKKDAWRSYMEKRG